jgi:hypothetical protein
MLGFSPETRSLHRAFLLRIQPFEPFVIVIRNCDGLDDRHVAASPVADQRTNRTLIDTDQMNPNALRPVAGARAERLWFNVLSTAAALQNLRK